MIVIAIGGLLGCLLSSSAWANERPRAVNDPEPPQVYTTHNNPTYGTLYLDDVLDNDWDPDGDDLIVVAILDDPNNDPSEYATVSVLNETTIEYVPKAGQVASGVTFRYRIWDQVSEVHSAIVTVQQTENTRPRAWPDTATVTAGESVLIDVMANDVDDDGDPLILLPPPVLPDHGTAVVEGNMIRYTPDPWFESGFDQFWYRIYDGQKMHSQPVDIEVVALPGGPSHPVELAPTAQQTGEFPFWPIIRSNEWWPDTDPTNTPPRILGGLYSITGMPVSTTGGEPDKLFVYAGSGAINGHPGPGSECLVNREQTLIFSTDYDRLSLLGLGSDPITYHGIAGPCQTDSRFDGAHMMPGGALYDSNRDELPGDPDIFLTMEAAWNPMVAQGFHHVLLGHSSNAVDFKHLLMIRIADTPANDDWGLHAAHCQPDDGQSDRWFCYANIVGKGATTYFDVIWDQPAPWYGRVRFCMDSQCNAKDEYRMGGPLVAASWLGGGSDPDVDGVGDHVTRMPYRFRRFQGFDIQGVRRIDGRWVGYAHKYNRPPTAPPCSGFPYDENVSTADVETDQGVDIVVFETSPHWQEGPDKILQSNIRTFPGWSNTASSFPFFFEDSVGRNYLYSTTQEDTVCTYRYPYGLGLRSSLVATELNDTFDLE